MQNDLISRSELIEILTKYQFGAIKNDTQREYIKETVLQFVRTMPTAYDVEKVVEETDKVLADLNVVEILSHFETDKTIQKSLCDFLCAFKDEISRLIRNGGKE